MKCFIYRNLNRKGVWYSLKAVDGPHKGLVVGYAPALLVKNANLVVSQPGRLRVIANKKKNVHAGVVGEVIAVYNYEPRRIDLSQSVGTSSWLARAFYNSSFPITYNPYKYESFVNLDTLDPIHKALYVSFWYREVRASV